MIEFAPLMDAVTYSSILSLLAVGITLLYKTTKVPNFAHASLATLGAYVTYSLTRLIGINPYLSLPASFVMGGLVALSLFFVILEPMRKRGSSITMLMIGTLAFDVIVYGVLNAYADYLQTALKIPSRVVSLIKLDFTVMGFPGVFITSIALLAVSAAVLHFVLNRTYLGIALRASMENQVLAEVIGINTRFTLMVSWFIAGGLAGLGGALLPLWTQIDPGIGILLIAAMFCASILGGLEEIYGAFLGGFLLGFAELLGTLGLAKTIGAWVVPYRPAIPLIILSITLIAFPSGLVEIVRKRRVAK
ncbi:MAG: branched-chain amino acid ABC transporter permease [Thermoprotei archaeon]